MTRWSPRPVGLIVARASLQVPELVSDAIRRAAYLANGLVGGVAIIAGRAHGGAETSLAQREVRLAMALEKATGTGGDSVAGGSATRGTGRRRKRIDRASGGGGGRDSAQRRTGR